MRLKCHMSNGKKYYSIVKSVYEGSKPKKKIIYYYGRLTDEEAEKIKLWLKCQPGKNKDCIPVDFNKTIITESKMHGNVALCYQILKNIGIHRVISESFNGVSKKALTLGYIEMMIINRLCEPKSELALVDWIPKTTLFQIMGKSKQKLYENQFYRAMDKLWKAKDKVEYKIWTEITSKIITSVALYKDITTTYFEGNGPKKIAMFGPSKEHRYDCKQVKWGLVVTKEGYPVTMEIYEGNKSEMKTIVETVRRVKNVFGLQNGIIIGDRGVVSDDNCKEIREEKYGYIFTEKNDNVEEIIEDCLRRGLRKIKRKIKNADDGAREIITYSGEKKKKEEEVEVIHAQERVVGDERYIIIFSEEKKKQDEEEINRILRKGKEVLKWAHGEVREIAQKETENIQLKLGEVNEKREVKKKYIKSRPPKDPDEMIKAVAKKMQCFHGDRYYKYGWHITKGFWSEKKENEIKKHQRYAGIWVIRTTENNPTEEIIDLYRGMQVIEDGFKTIKSVLKVRPVGHHREDRCEIHIFICVLGYYIEKMIEEKIKMCAEKIISEFKNVIANKEVLPGTGIEKWKITNLNKQQKMILNALEIDEKAIEVGWMRLL